LHKIPKQLLAWLRQWLPQQKNAGSGAVQVGKASSDVTVVNITHHATTHMPRIQANASHRLSPVPAPSTIPKRQVNPAQREVLYLISNSHFDFLNR
jgi:hypothetical protein